MEGTFVSLWKDTNLLLDILEAKAKQAILLYKKKSKEQSKKIVRSVATEKQKVKQESVSETKPDQKSIKIVTFSDAYLSFN